MNVALLSIVSYVTSEIDSSLLTRKSNFRNDKTLGLLSLHWSPKLYATSGFWKEVAGLSFCVAFVLALWAEAVMGHPRRAGCVYFVGFPTCCLLSHNSVNGGHMGCLSSLIK